MTLSTTAGAITYITFQLPTFLHINKPLVSLKLATESVSVCVMWKNTLNQITNRQQKCDLKVIWSS